LLDPHTEHPELANGGIDLYHMARQTEASLADLDQACWSGVRTINPYGGVDLIADRLRCLQRLDEHGICVPDHAYGTSDTVDLDPPVIVKPQYEIGPESHRLRTVLDPPLEFEGCQFVERYVPGDRTIELHRLGDTLRAVAFTDGENGPQRESRPTPAICKIYDTIHELTEMSIFEVDLVGGDDFAVVDVNSAVSVGGVADGREVSVPHKVRY
jgi:hypothetical protein